MPDLPNPEYQRMFQRVAAQGETSAAPAPLDEEGARFYGFLAKADEIADGIWDVFFEVSDKRQLDVVLSDRNIAVMGPLPELPGLAYHLPKVPQETLLEALGLDKIAELVEGSWYELELVPGESGASGELYDPDPEVA